MTRRHALAAPAACAILSPEVARADWRLLGSREVDHRVERHEIDTGIAGGLDGAGLASPRGAGHRSHPTGLEYGTDVGCTGKRREVKHGEELRKSTTGSWNEGS